MQPVELVCDCMGPDYSYRGISMRHESVPNGLPAVGRLMSWDTLRVNARVRRQSTQVNLEIPIALESKSSAGFWSVRRLSA